MANGRILKEIKALLAEDEIDTTAAVRLMLESQVEMLESHNAHSHAEYAPVEHRHQDINGEIEGLKRRDLGAMLTAAVSAITALIVALTSKP